MSTKIETGINWTAVRAEMDCADWEQMDKWTEERLVFLGTVFNMCPSGKYYMPFACSNVDPCFACRGTGHQKKRRPRQWKKWRSAANRLRRLAAKRGLSGESFLRSALATYNTYLKRHGWGYPPACPHCNGVGSREVYLDNVYYDTLDREASRHGFAIVSGEGDPCDIFACETREIPDRDN